LSLAEYLTALHVHITGDSLTGFPRDRKELILQYLSGLASTCDSQDQVAFGHMFWNNALAFYHCFAKNGDFRNLKLW
jgi:hypothetical protein